MKVNTFESESKALKKRFCFHSSNWEDREKVLLPSTYSKTVEEQVGL